MPHAGCLNYMWSKNFLLCTAHYLSSKDSKSSSSPALMISILMCVVTSNSDIKNIHGRSSQRRKEKGKLNKMEGEGSRMRGHTELLCEALP